jgi:membrane fusion protein (multidrug efflux system)
MTNRDLSARATALLSFTALALMLAGCKPAGSAPGDRPPPEVAVVTVQPQSIPATFEYVGQTAGSREVEVRARVAGILQKRNYREGGSVKAGESLFTIDPAPFQTALAKADADVASSEARLAQAKRNAARLKPLLEAKAVSQKEYDDAASAEQVAEADLKSARAKLDEAKLNLGYTGVEAPVYGIASRALRSEGSYVSGPDVLLTTVSQIDPMYVLFGVSDSERLKLNSDVRAGRLTLPRDGQFEVTVKLSDGSVYARPGRLNFSDVRISGATGTSEARAELPNPSGQLHPGEFVRVSLKGAQRPNAILVPQRAVLEGPKGKFVYVVNAEGKAEPRSVELGDWSADTWIVTSGLAGGDRVIVDGVMKIGPGTPVKVAGPQPQGADAARGHGEPKAGPAAPAAADK